MTHTDQQLTLKATNHAHGSNSSDVSHPARHTSVAAGESRISPSTAPPILDGRHYRTRSAEVIYHLERYRPMNSEKTWATVQDFVRDAVTLTADKSSYAPARLLAVAGPFVLWCVGERGLPLDIKIIFSRRTISAYCLQVGRSDATRSSYRSALLRISETVLPEAHPAPMAPMARRTIQPPYSAAEMTLFRAWATGQHTDLKRRRAKMMLAFSAGAGLWPAEIELVKPEDITSDDTGVLITVSGKTPRHVPLMRSWEGWLREAAESSEAGQPMWGARRETPNKNLLTNFTNRSMGRAPTNARLRATWITQHVALGTPMKAFFRASGVQQFGNLHHYLTYVDELDDNEYRKLLRDGASA